MNARYALSVLFAAIMAFAPAAPAASQTILPVNACAANLVDMFWLAGGGVTNRGPALNWVYCGIGQDRALDTNDNLLVYFSDSNPATDTVQNFLCGTYAVDEDWSSLITTGSKYGCSTAGGCDANEPGFVGNNYLRIAPFRHGGVYSTSLFCLIPAEYLSQNSQMISIRLDQF